ncbi:IS3 family transposase [Streptococcus pyogenes]|uniref:IS3 family transposase n=1 Tax=Streptococcus pyogenes TaxID=1314 RepID=UPI0039047A4D
MIIDYCTNNRIKIKRKGLSPLQHRNKSFTSNRVANFWGSVQFLVFLSLITFHC